MAVPSVVENGRTGLLVPPDDPETLAEVLLQLVQDEDLRRDLGAAARAEAERRFSLARVCNEWMRVYREVAQQV
jgi:glycosyltransferase involved in cell wall biosynthesis